MSAFPGPGGINSAFPTPGELPSKNVQHNGVYCDNCSVQNIVGVRYHCAMCTDYDLCEKCIDDVDTFHDNNHAFFRIYKNKDIIQKYPCMLNLTNICHSGVNCAICNVSDIKGFKYQCVQCNISLCESCEIQGKHDPTHTRMKYGTISNESQQIQSQQGQSQSQSQNQNHPARKWHQPEPKPPKHEHRSYTTYTTLESTNLVAAMPHPSSMAQTAYDRERSQHVFPQNRDQTFMSHPSSMQQTRTGPQLSFGMRTPASYSDFHYFGHDSTNRLGKY
jgi:hypothetical protein